MKSMLFRAGFLCIACAIVTAAPAAAATIVTQVHQDYSTSPYMFSFGDSSFTLQYSGDIFGPTSISTGGTGMVNTIFGAPTTNFPDRGSVSFGANDQYASIGTPTEISYSNGGNLIGLSATDNGATYYGFVYTTNAFINSYGFQTSPGVSINATAAISSVPETSTWAMMMAGFGMIGGMMRRRSRTTASRMKPSLTLA